MRWSALIVAAGLMVGGVAQAHATHRQHNNGHARHHAVHHNYVIDSRPFQTRGIATVSWYGLNDGSGQHTAQGRPFNPYAMGVAAPTTYPFGTKVRFTVIETGCSAVATVMDRNGPGVARGGRLFDVYAGTAKALGIYGAGTAKVRFEVVNTVADGTEVAEDAGPSSKVQDAWSRKRR